MKHVLPILLLLICLTARSQESSSDIREAQNALVERLKTFGKVVPQEKVYIHMDNTCYFQGDTIWFAAYLRQTTDDCPSLVSRVLYVELLNNDGYLVERKLVEMVRGRGEGFFALNKPIQYSGFYELRAYTRWQLNWGQTVREHQRRYIGYMREAMERQYLDYEKLYSRVFPVYDRPKEAGEYTRDMTLRHLQRYYSKDPNERKVKLMFYPEGGNLIAGIENRVAFEATMDDGEWMEGNLAISPAPNGGNDAIKTQNRGRGTFTIVPEAGKTYEVTFTTPDGNKVKEKLPKAETEGVSLQVRQEGDSIVIETKIAGLAPDTLALTVMNEGKVEDFWLLAENRELRMSKEDLHCGVNQATVFDTQGRVYADRLFFVTKQDEMQPTLTIDGIRDNYQPYEKISLGIKGKAQDTPISLAVRDVAQMDNLFDNASILTEMLLSSEIRGFVPDPGWYFEAEDDEHRQALDLLMMTQGWRRFNWRDMAVKGEWELTHPNEATPILTGYVDRYWSGIINNGFATASTAIRNTLPDFDTGIVSSSSSGSSSNSNGLGTSDSNEQDAVAQPDDGDTEGESLSLMENALNNKQKKKKKKSRILVHAELITGDIEPQIGDIETVNGDFQVQLPRYYGSGLFYIGASDTTKWDKKKKYTWVQQKYNDEDSPAGLRNRIKFYVEEPEYIVRLRFPYPQFVNPFTFQQNHLMSSRDTLNTPPELLADGTRVLNTVTVRARRGGLRRFDDSQPVLILDAYEAYNAAIDDGLTNGSYDTDDDGELAVKSRFQKLRSMEEMMLYAIIGDMNTFGSTNAYNPVRYGPGATRRGITDELRDIPIDSIYYPKYLNSKSWMGDSGIGMSPGEMYDYDRLCKLDKFLIYTDYAPRLYGDKRYDGANGPQNTIVVYPYPDGSRRPEYRDRRYLIEGFAELADFYSPDYSQRVPQEPKDYRRTLYWNANVKLDDEGHANVTFYNNSRTMQLSVSAAGQTSEGTLLWNEQ